METVLTAAVLAVEIQEKEITVLDVSMPEESEIVSTTTCWVAAVQRSTSEKEQGMEPESGTATPGMMNVTSQEEKEEPVDDNDTRVSEETKDGAPQTQATVPTKASALERSGESMTGSEQALDSEKTLKRHQVDVAEHPKFDTRDNGYGTFAQKSDSLIDEPKPVHKPSAIRFGEATSTHPEPLPAESESPSSKDGTPVAINDLATSDTRHQPQGNSGSPTIAAPGRNKVEAPLSSSFSTSALPFSPIHKFNDKSADRETGYSFWSHPTFILEHQPTAPGPQAPSCSSPFPQQRAGKQRLSRLERIEQQRQTTAPKMKSRCQYWPACTNKNCKYSHPSKPCR